MSKAPPKPSFQRTAFGKRGSQTLGVTNSAIRVLPPVNTSDSMSSSVKVDQVEPPQFFTPGMRATLVASVLLVISCFFLFIIPGYWMYLAGDFPFGDQFGVVHGDNLLTISMLTQLLVAAALPITYACVRRFVYRPAIRKTNCSALFAKAGAALVFAGILCLWVVLLAVYFHSQLGRAAPQ